MHKTLLREIKEDLNKWRNILFYGSEDSIALSILHKLIYRFNATPIKITAAFFFFVEIDQLTKIHKEIHSSSSVFPFYNERSQDTAQLFLFSSTSCQELQFLSTGCENMRAVRGQKPGSDQLRRQCLYNWDAASGQTLLAKVRPRPRFFVPSWAHISYFGLEDGACMSH